MPAELGRQLLQEARQSQACRLLMSVPGVGAITAMSFLTAVEDPENFRKSRSVGAWLGLTTRRYQSGEVDYDGHISRRGDRHLRGLLYEAAAVILTRVSTESSLRVMAVIALASLTTQVANDVLGPFPPSTFVKC